MWNADFRIKYERVKAQLLESSHELPSRVAGPDVHWARWKPEREQEKEESRCASPGLSFPCRGGPWEAAMGEHDDGDGASSSNNLGLRNFYISCLLGLQEVCY